MKILVYLLVYTTVLSVVQANQIDIGIFNSESIPNKIEILIRPDFNISSIQTVSGILYTVRWDDPSIVITTQYVEPFFIAPQGSPVFYNGYYYQVYAAVPMTPMAMNANQEYLISSFTYLNGECAKFEIIEDDWTQSQNGNVYLEFLGLNVTGIIYQSNVTLGSFGGFISGSDTINLSNSTGNMILVGYNGFVLTWQRKVNDGSWVDISGTVGVYNFSEIPETIGEYYYRALVQNGSCPSVYSEIHFILVVAEINLNLKIFLEGTYTGSGQMNPSINGILPVNQPYSASPWNYQGLETLPSPLSTDVVDWVLVEIRAGIGAGTTCEKKAGLLYKNGSVSVSFNTINPFSEYYIVVWHRNHLPIMTRNPVNMSLATLDLTTIDNLYGLNPAKSLGEGVFGMISGDSNADCLINEFDYTMIWTLQAAMTGYLNSDLNLDGQVNNKDKNDLWYPNLGLVSQVP